MEITKQGIQETAKMLFYFEDDNNTSAFNLIYMNSPLTFNNRNFKDKYSTQFVVVATLETSNCRMDLE